MAENKNQKPAFDFGSVLSKAKFTDEISDKVTGGRTRTPSAFDGPLLKAKETNKVLAFELPTDTVEDALKEARSAARYLGFRVEVGQTPQDKGMTLVELKPMPKRARKTKAEKEVEQNASKPA